jgi:tetratricopeptide (TPR) repeat protein
MWTRRRSERLRWALGALLAAASATSSAPARADADLEVFRERFRAGMEKYKAGQLADAIVEWEAIYRELGPARGYRLAFNLGRAYDAYGDSTRAAERFEAYLAEVEARRSSGQELEALVLKQEADAKERLGELARVKGRVKTAARRPTAVQIDSGEPRLSGFTAYVAPGDHRVTFEPGAPSARVVTVRVLAGEEAVVTDPGPPEAPPPPPRAPTVVVTDRPFPAWVLYATGGAAVASVVLPVLTYDRALTLRDRHDASADLTERASLADDYSTAKTNAYVSLAIPIALGSATAALAAWYFAGGREREVPKVVAAPTPWVTGGGGAITAVGRF